MITVDKASISGVVGTVKLNVFTEFHKLYRQLAGVKEKIFLNMKDITSEMNDTLKTYSIDICLLPHQVLILPKQYFDAMEKDIPFRFTIYQPEQLKALVLSNQLPKVYFKSNSEAVVRLFLPIYFT